MIFKQKSIKCIFHDDDTIELLEDMIVQFAGVEIGIPKGFTCDGSSIPRFFWRVCGSPKMSVNLKPGILHDYLYRTNMYDREYCDLIYFKALRSCGKNFVIAKMMYYAVRTFGASHY